MRRNLGTPRRLDQRIGARVLDVRAAGAPVPPARVMLRTMRWAISLMLPLMVTACSKPPPPPVAPPPVVSEGILIRPVVTAQATVQHILIGWGALASTYRGAMDPRARARDARAAAALTRQIFDRARRGEPFEQLMQAYSEDGNTAKQGGSYVIRADGEYAPELQALALRLGVGEVGVCQTTYGYHVVKRIH